MTDLLYSDVEDSLRASVRDALARRLDSDAVARLYDEPNGDLTAIWALLASDLGLAALLVPEEFGGAGATAREAGIVMEELGRTVAPAPFLTSAVVATTALVSVGDGAALTALAAGDGVATLVVPWSARRGAWEPVGAFCAPVAGALAADLFVVPVQTGLAQTGLTQTGLTQDGPVPTSAGLELRLLTTADVEVEPLTSLDMSRPLARVTPTGPGRLLATGDAARAAVDEALGAGAALMASEQCALARWCLETTVDYAKTRIQFARPIGSFQAIKHRLADLFLEVTQAQAVARYAADTLASGDSDAVIAQSLAQAYCSDVAVHAAEEALQLHGGIGMTWEHPIHLYLKRAKSDQLALGTPVRHREDLGTLVDLVP